MFRDHHGFGGVLSFGHGDLLRLLFRLRSFFRHGFGGSLRHGVRGGLRVRRALLIRLAVGGDGLFFFAFGLIQLGAGVLHQFASAFNIAFGRARFHLFQRAGQLYVAGLIALIKGSGVQHGSTGSSDD